MIEERLKRNDKIALSGGKKVLWAPEFPRYAHRLGFWDYAFYLNYPIAPLFTVTILDEQLNEIPLNRIEREWLPSHLTQYYMPFDEIEVKEEKTLLQNDVLVSRITLKNLSETDRKFRAIAWTGQVIQENLTSKNPEKTPNANFIQNIENSDRLVSLQRRINNQKGELFMRYGMAIGTRRRSNSFSISTSEYLWNIPEWKLSPFFEKMIDNGLPNDSSFKGLTLEGEPKELLFMALEYQILLPAKSAHEIQIFCAIRDEQEEAMDALVLATQFADPVAHATKSWERFFDSVPNFKCSNPFFEKYYWYRWFGLRKNTVDTDNSLSLRFPCIFEGTNPSELRFQTSFSTPGHILETRWMHSPEIAQGSLLNFIAHQRNDGSFPGRIATGFHAQHPGFFHANWGRAIRALFQIHPDLELMNQLYPALKKYARYFRRERDKNDWQLYDIVTTEETGINCSSRYLSVSRRADTLENIRLKGIEVSVYLYEIFRTLQWMASQIGNLKEAQEWEAAAQGTRSAILKYMWHGEHHFFYDINSMNGTHSRYKFAGAFAVFATDIAEKKHLPMLYEHLFNPDVFWTPFPAPAIGMDTEEWDAFGEWQEKRRARPGNGRSWMFLNSQIAEALGVASQQLDPELKPRAVEFMLKLVQMQFQNGDSKFPISYEYVNPLNGKPPYFRGSDDHINFVVNDLIIKYVVGLQPQDDNRVIIDPLPFGFEYFEFENVKVRGHSLKISYNQRGRENTGGQFQIFVDGKLTEQREKLERISLVLGE